MESDHAPIMCSLGRAAIKPAQPKLKFKKADWISYGHVLDEMIDQFDYENSPEGISPFLDEIFAGLVMKAANNEEKSGGTGNELTTIIRHF